MSALHTIHNPAALAPALARCGQEDALLLLEDGVYAALADHPHSARLKGWRVHVLREDLKARGLDENRLAVGLQPIAMSDFVALTVAFSPILAWS